MAESTLDTLNATIRTASTRRASGSAAFHGSPPRYSLPLYELTLVLGSPYAERGGPFVVERCEVRRNYPQCSEISKWRRPYLNFLSSSRLPGPEGPGNNLFKGVVP